MRAPYCQSSLTEDILPEIVDTFAALVAHASRVITEDDNVEESELDEIDSQVLRNTPLSSNALNGTGRNNMLSDMVDSLWVEATNTALSVSTS